MTIDKLELRKKELESTLQQLVNNYNLCQGHIAEIVFQIEELLSSNKPVDEPEFVVIE